MVTTTGGPQVIVQAHGDVSSAEREYARSKVERLHGLAGAPVLFARVDLRVFADPARDRPADAKASLDVNGRLVRAHVAAGTVPEAVDLLEARLRERLARAAGRAAPDRSGARGGSARRADRPGFAPLAPEDREIVTHKTFAVGEQTVDEAVDDLERLDHDFFLFRNDRTGEDNVLARADGG
jgi:ribosome-associated translation inhibitor RaiA